MKDMGGPHASDATAVSGLTLNVIEENLEARKSRHISA